MLSGEIRGGDVLHGTSDVAWCLEHLCQSVLGVVDELRLLAFHHHQHTVVINSRRRASILAVGVRS